MKLKRILILSLITFFLLSLTACKNNEIEKTEQNTEITVTPSPTEKPTPTPTPTPIPEIDEVDRITEVHNYNELTKALKTDIAAIKLADDFSTENEKTSYVIIDRAVVLDGNNVIIDFGFEVTTGGVTIKNFNIITSEYGKAVSKNGELDTDGNMINGNCAAIEIYNTTIDAVIIEKNTITHNVPLNNNSSIYITDNTFAYVINNNIKTDNEIYVGLNTSGKVEGNTILKLEDNSAN